MADPFDGFLGGAPAPPRGPSKAVARHPRSMDPTDPYLLLEQEDWFDFVDTVSDTAGTKYQAREIIARPGRGFHDERDGELEYHIYGFPYLKGGRTLGQRPASHIPIKPSQIPARIKERIDSQWPPPSSTP